MTSFGQIIKEIGEFGLFQKRLLFALCLPSIFASFDVIGQVFTGMYFPHHCNTDWILERGPNLTEEKQKNLTLPVNEDGSFESCKMFTPVDLDLETIEAYGINSTTGCTDGWDYDTHKGASSTATEFDLVCDRSGLIQISQSVYMSGFLVGAVACGAVNDRFGRRFSIIFYLSLLMLFGVSCAFAPNIYVLMVFKFFRGATGGVTVMNTSVMGVEWTDPSKAAICTEVICMCFSVGLLILSGIAHLVPDWRTLELVLFCPLVILVGLFYRFLPESARWLLATGRKEEARKQLQRAARINGRTFPEEQFEKLEIEDMEKRKNMLDIIKIPYLRKQTSILCYNWFSVSLLYYGLSLNVGDFGLNIYLTQFIFGLVEFPANMFALFLLLRVGRRIPQAGFMSFAGATCLLTLAVPKDLPVVVTIIAVLGKGAATASFSTAYIYSAELYPTVLRQNGVGLNSMFARVAGISAPLIRLLEVYHYSIPMVIYGTIPIVAGGFCLLLPETRNVELQDHAEIQ
ncbi:solute carrier family 22 member 13-like [Antennarius striatus]|uniref:solute carrier family 22 member 13-like n=1 Tax=Antennarius striatus TaxID=241820 RepID=UPI0035B25A75